MLGRWLLVGGAVVLIAVGAWFGLPESKKSLVVGDPVVDFALPDLKGTLEQLPKGEVMLVNFWATWCPPCRQEMPSMIELYKKYESKGLKIVAVSVDRDASALRKFVDEYNIPFDVLHDANSAVSSSYGVFRYPETFLIDRQGVIQAHLVGAVEWMSPMVQQNIEALLGNRSLALQP